MGCEKFGAAKADLHNLTVGLAHPDAIASLIRPVRDDDQPADQILDKVLQAKSDGERSRTQSRQKRIFRRRNNLGGDEQGAEPDQDPERRFNLAQQKTQANILTGESVQEAVQPAEQHPRGSDEHSREQDLADRKLGHYGLSTHRIASIR